MQHRSTRAALSAGVLSLLLVLAAILPSVAEHHEDTGDGIDRARPGVDRAHPGRGRGVRAVDTLAVHHGPVEVTLAGGATDGHAPGDVRTTSIETTDLDGSVIGRLDATLTTTAVDVPDPGDEVRISTLVFSFGEDGADQIVVSGSAHYPADGPTIATGDVTTRSVIGGSGRYAGATGSAVTRHLDDGTWVHELMLDRSPSVIGPDSRLVRPGIARIFRAQLQEGVRAFRAQQRLEERSARAAAKAELRARKAEAKAARVAAKARVKAARAAARGADEVTIVDAGDTDGADTGEVGITRIDLGIADPGSAPGEQLGLWQYHIPAGSELAPHTHAGWQIARIARGELEYTVIAGEGTIIHADGSSTPIGPGTYVLRTGDSVVENPDLEHFGANRTDEEVVILAATLYEEGAPLSIPLETADDTDEEAPEAEPVPSLPAY